MLPANCTDSLQSHATALSKNCQACSAHLFQSTKDLSGVLQLAAVLLGITAQIILSSKGKVEFAQRFKMFERHFEIARMSIAPLLFFDGANKTIEDIKKISQQKHAYYALKSSVGVTDMAINSVFAVSCTVTAIVKDTFPKLEAIADKTNYVYLLRHGLKITEYAVGVGTKAIPVGISNEYEKKDSLITLIGTTIAALNIFLIINRMHPGSTGVWPVLMAGLTLSGLTIYMDSYHARDRESSSPYNL